MDSARPGPPEALRVPGFPGPLALRLPAGIATLRERALDLHYRNPWKDPFGWPIPELPLADARAWAARPPGEAWLVWRARRVAERLRALPIELEPGERVVGKPRFHRPSPDEQAELDAARQVLATVPPYPGGDAGHLHPDYERLFRIGIGGLLAEVEARQGAAAGDEQRVFYEACRIALRGLEAFVRRVAAACREVAERDTADHERWQALADLTERVALAPPATFHEALELTYLTIVALWFGEDHHLTTPGRLDQTLRPLYEADLAAGRLTRQGALELISCLYIQLNRITPVGLAESVMVGGRDSSGRDVTNDLTYLCLAARLATGLSYPTIGLAWHEDTPTALADFAVELLSAGRGDPAFFNEEVIARGLRDHGVSHEDSYDFMNSTCVEIKVVGRSHVWVTSPYINLPQGLLDVVEAVARGEAPEPASYAELSDRVRRRLAGRIAGEAARLDRVWRDLAERGGFPLASCLTLDCLERGRDFHRDGARYNWVENSFVGLANLVDSLIAVRELVYGQRELGLAELAAVLRADFAGHEPLRQRILNTLPKYGNDEPEPDALAREWAEFLIAATEAQAVGPHRYVPGFFCWVMHERLGQQTGATPDGRRAGWPLADGAGGAQGREKRGPTAAVLSTTSWSHQAALGGLVHNAKFAPSTLRGEGDRRALRSVIETYLRRGGFEVQVNVVGRETLLAARAHPEQHRDLLVRVAGYSDYFVKLGDKLQEEVIARTEHEF